MSKKSIPICPKCGAAAHSIVTKYGPRYEHCDLWSWGNFPLVDKETHDLRQLAHSKFDPIWQSRKVSRTEAYRNLARKLKIPYRKCHMKLMGKKTLKKVLKIIEKEKKYVA